jgi:uncharacterized protein involved in copper resistance
MRRWLVLLMLVLLPLRGWVGEALAGEMIQQQLQQAAPAALHAMDHPNMAHAMDHDCAGHDDHAGPAQHGQPAAQGCGTCASCQVCSAFALAVPVTTVQCADFGHAPPLFDAPRFASAERQAAFKPPKS